jgi:RNA polymerase sigma factor (sigma-70 family)
MTSRTLGELEDMRRVIDDALSQLSPSVAAAVSLRVMRELPYSEVAERLGCSEGAARVRVARGLSLIADLIEPPSTT